MGRTPLFDGIARAFSLATRCNELGISTKEGLERAAAQQHAHATRRQLLKGVGAAAALGVVGLPRFAHAGKKPPAGAIAVVGAGLSGLACADTLATAGVAATVYEGRDRVGGRQWSMGGSFGGPVNFPGQVVERGGELIDTTHMTMKGYAQQFGLVLEDVTKKWLPGETSYFFRGRHVSEEEVVDGVRDLVDSMRPIMSELTNGVNYANHDAFDEEQDFKNLRQLLEELDPAEAAFDAIEAAYTIEYGREIELQTGLAFMLFWHLDKRSRFQPFGVWSDERYHVVSGNEGIAQGLRGRLPNPVDLGMTLLAVRRLSDGRVQLTFDDGGTIVTKTHDAVVLTLPYSTLRLVDLSNLNLPAWQTDMIQNFDYGRNSKMNVGFTSRVWGQSGSKGDSYSDLPNHQGTWEPNPTNATATRAVMLDYSGGARGESLNPAKAATEAQAWLDDLELIWPGANAAARRDNKGKPIAHIQNWSQDPFSRGSYTSNAPGYFTTIEGRQATRLAPNIFVAGEHTDGFYEWQGFMEGACNSGIRAAGEVLAAL